MVQRLLDTLLCERLCVQLQRWRLADAEKKSLCGESSREQAKKNNKGAQFSEGCRGRQRVRQCVERCAASALVFSSGWAGAVLL
jgi:hypothetical protein